MKLFLLYSISCSISLRFVIKVKLDSSKEWKTSISWSGCLKNISSSSEDYSKFSAPLILLKFWFCCSYISINSSIFNLSYSDITGLRLCKNNLYFLRFCNVYRFDIFLPVRSAWIYSFYLMIATFSFLDRVWSSAFFIASLASFLFSFK